MTSDRAEEDQVVDPPSNLHLAGTAAVVGQLPLEVLVHQLEHAAMMNDELRMMLREERHQLALRIDEIFNLNRHVRPLEDTVKQVQDQSEARHAEIERLGALVTQTQAELRAVHQSRTWRRVQRYNSFRRALWRLRARAQ